MRANPEQCPAISPFPARHPVTSQPRLGLGELLILAAGFSDTKLDFVDMLEGWSGAEEKGGGRLGDGKSPRDQL